MYLFADRLKEVIEQKGVSQKWLADEAHTTEATISRYINGQKKPAVLGILGDIATALGVSTDYLLGVTNIPYSKDSISPEAKILLAAFDRANDDDREVMWALLKKYLTPQEKGCLPQSTQTRNSTAG